MPHLNNAAAGFNTLEQLAARRSAIHSLHPFAKLFVTVFYIVTVISINIYDMSRLIPFFIYPVIIMAVSDTPYAPILRRLIPVLPFSLFAGLSNIIFDTQTAFELGGTVITLGMVSCGVIIIKTVMTVSSVLLLISTTTWADLIGELYALRLPPIFILQLTMTYRYLSVLLDEASNMFTAYTLRAPNQRGIKITYMGSFLGGLLIRSIDRAERVYAAMRCRGFNGSFAGAGIQKIRPRDYAYLIFICTAFLFLRLKGF